MDHANGKSHDTWEIQGYWIFQWHSPLEIPLGVEIRFYITGGIVIGAYHIHFLFIITMIFMYTFRKTRLKILNVIVRSTNDSVSIQNWSNYLCEKHKIFNFHLKLIEKKWAYSPQREMYWASQNSFIHLRRSENSKSRWSFLQGSDKSAVGYIIVPRLSGGVG